MCGGDLVLLPKVWWADTFTRVECARCGWRWWLSPSSS